MCGGDPYYTTASTCGKQYSPRVWRWSYSLIALVAITEVFSTCVEVILIRIIGRCARVTYSPRVWRWSQYLTHQPQNHQVFSTCVEVILSFNKTINGVSCILHVCGGDPIAVPTVSVGTVYSPRVWRWSFTRLCKTINTKVFSTCVEVIPDHLHACAWLT